ncbi:hypothetical protein Q1695_002921 [Nippostrongylus brasiliensis]|nr:hypothetical protein Q1695_002921 [Nippostrongylus brasiliensis]
MNRQRLSSPPGGSISRSYTPPEMGLGLCRVTNAHSFCGFPTRTVCLVLGLITAATEIFSFTFLPTVAAWLMIAISVMSLFLLGIGAFKFFPWMVDFYMTCIAALKLCSGTVIYYTIYASSVYNSYEAIQCRTPGAIIQSDTEKYHCFLLNKSQAMLGAGTAISIICLIVTVPQVFAARKLKYYCRERKAASRNERQRRVSLMDA